MTFNEHANKAAFYVRLTNNPTWFKYSCNINKLPALYNAVKVSEKRIHIKLAFNGSFYKVKTPVYR